MSDTIVDMPKVTQMLDAGWTVQISRQNGSSYIARAQHPNRELWERAKQSVLIQTIEANKDAGTDRATLVDWNNTDFDTPGEILTDDFTPEQALTRLAYKVHGEII